MNATRFVCAAVVALGCGVLRAQPTPWVLAATGGPPPRHSSIMSFDSIRGRTVLFSGEGNGPGNYALRDTWEWDGGTWSLRAESGPPFRIHSATAFDSRRGKTVVFGGNGTGPGELADTWEWDGAAWIQRALGAASPPPRQFHAMAYDSRHGVTVLFGGAQDGNPLATPLSDTWEWDGTSWTLRAITGPSPRFAHAMAFDSARGVTVLFGGLTSPWSGSIRSGETWEWNGSQWDLRTSGGPTGRIDHTMAYDTQRGLTLLFGGDANAYIEGGFWYWDGQAWSRGQHEGGPTGGVQYRLVYDTLRQRAILHSSYHACWTMLMGTWERASIPGWCYANCDGSTTPPILNTADFICFLSRYAAGEPYANCDQGYTCNLNVEDFVCYINRFAAGCP